MVSTKHSKLRAVGKASISLGKSLHCAKYPMLLVSFSLPWKMGCRDLLQGKFGNIHEWLIFDARTLPKAHAHGCLLISGCFAAAASPRGSFGKSCAAAMGYARQLQSMCRDFPTARVPAELFQLGAAVLRDLGNSA